MPIILSKLLSIAIVYKLISCSSNSSTLAQCAFSISSQTFVLQSLFDQLKTLSIASSSSLQTSNSTKLNFSRSIFCSTSMKLCFEIYIQLEVFSVANLVFQLKLKFSKFEKFISSSLCSTSIKLSFEAFTQSQVSLVASFFAKFDASANDIGFFDSTILLDFSELYLFNTSNSFIEELDTTSLNYQVESVLAALAKCLRGPTYK